MFDAIGQSDPPQKFKSKLSRRSIPAQFHRHGDVLQRGQRGDELKILKNKTDMLIADASPLIFADLVERDSVQKH